MKRPWIPLATKVLLGLFLNLAIVGATFTTVLVLQIRINPGWLLAGRAGERLRAVADMLAGDLGRMQPGDEAGVLERYHVAYDLDLMLLDPTGRIIAGGSNNIPAQVQQEIVRPRNGNGGPRENRPPEEPPASDAAPRPRPGPPRGGPRLGPIRHSVLRAGTPPAYWILIPLPPMRPGPALVLLVRAPSLWSGGFLLDVRPWILAGAGALVLSVLFWLPIVRGITRDIHRMASRTEDIAAGRFEARLVLTRNDELGRLSGAIDQMASRLAHHVAGQRRFLGDAAHELSSPLARMQAILAILESRPPTDHPAYLLDLQEELDEMASLVSELLSFSRALHGRDIRLEPLELRPLVERAWAREYQEGMTLLIDVPAGLHVLADAQLLQRGVANLLRNAVRYAGSAGPISATARLANQRAVLSISDLGPGVSPESLPRLFEPFFRPEDSRSREFGGAGLGLAIVKTCIDACRGTVTASNRNPAGFEVVIQIPAA